jgi:hypothetical protein
MTFSRLLFLFAALNASAAVVVSNISVTATQALLPFTAPDSSACQVEVSESSSYVPLVHDVDPALFQGANLDSRAGSISRDNERIFVVGKRAAEAALDSVRYSRALQTATTHYYRITCSGQVVTGTFTTSTIPFGNTYAEAEAADPLHPGQYAYPTLSSNDPTQAVVDPQTGVLLKRLTMPSDVTVFGPGSSGFQIGRGTAWTRISNMLAGTGVASVSGSTGKLFLGLDMTQGQFTKFISIAAGYGPLPAAFAYYQASITAAINQGGGAPANPEDGKYSTCLTIDGVNCYNGASVFTGLPSTSYTAQTFGTQNTIDLWQSTPGTKIPDYRDQGARASTSTCDGTANLTLTGGEAYSVNWGPGSTVTVGGVDYTIAQVNNTTRLTLATPCPAVASASSFGNNFGILVWKNTASADTLSIKAASVNFSTNFYHGTGAGDGTEFASPTTVMGPNGHPGFNYRSGSTLSGTIFWVDDVTGQGYVRGTVSGTDCGIFSGQFYANDPDTHLCGSGAGISLKKFYFPFGRSTSIGIFEATGPCNTGGSNVPPYTNQQPCYVAQNLTPGTSLTALTQAFTSNPAYAPQFEPARFINIALSSSDTLGNILIQAASGTTGEGGSIGWAIVFKPSATSNTEGGRSSGATGNHGCVGGGAPGCIVAAMPVWARTGCRWCPIKGTAMPSGGWASGYVFPWTNTSVGTGPYSVPIVDGTANGTVNFFDGSSTLQACPPNPFNVTGTVCTTVTVGAEPSSPVHGSVETGLPGEIGNLAIGDQLGIPSGGPYTEQIRLIKKVPGALPGTWVDTFQRKFNQGGDFFNGYGTTGPNPTLATFCGSNQTPWVGRSGAGWFWNFTDDPHGMNADGTTIPPDGSSQGDHLFWANGNQGMSSQNVLETRCAAGIFGCYSTRVRSAYSSFTEELASGPTAVVFRNPSFAGGAQDTAFLQSHPSGGGLLAGDRANYMFDGRPFYGGISSGSVTDNGSSPATLVGAQLYKFTAAQMPDLDLPYRKWTPTGAFTGNMPLVDVSSAATGNTIPADPTGAYTYCVAAAANECRVGSAVGDVYVNAPYVHYPFCYIASQNGNLSDEYDICIAGSSAIRDAVVQIGMAKVDNSGIFQRVISKFVRARTLSVFFTPYVFPDGKWLTFESNLGGDGSVNKPYLVAKIPPPAEDSINRSTFEPIDIILPGGDQVTGAYVQFGYVENGAAGAFFCTSRAESCVATASAVDRATPFYLKQTEAPVWSPAPCSAGCKISIPGIPQRTLYYQYIYTSATGDVVYTSPVNVVLVP